MKTILVPTDFSKISENALNYAIELAKAMRSKIILLHTYYSSIPSNGDNLQIDHELEKKNNEALEKLKESIKANVPDLKVELHTQFGLLTDVITEISKEKNVDLIIIGLSEAGVFEETIFGNEAVDTIRNLTSPVLIIPSKATYKQPTKIVFATDYLELKNDETLLALMNFTTQFKANLHIVNIMNEDEKISSKKVASIINVKKTLKKINYFIYFPINENVVNGINEFALETNAEIIAIIPHKHNIFYKLFNLSNTKKMAFHAHLPILALPENIAKQEQIETEISALNNVNFQYLEY